MEQPVRDAAEWHERHVRMTARAQHDDPGIMFVRGSHDFPGDVTEFGLPDLAVGGDSSVFEVGQDRGDDFLAFALAAVDLQPAPAANSDSCTCSTMT
jgi:hypothetical protein